MSGFSLADLHTNIVRSLRGRCLRAEAGLIAKNGDRHEHCGTCMTRCGGEDLGMSGGVSVGRVWGSDDLELRWACPACSCEVTQETTALASLADANEVKRDPLCYACRKREDYRPHITKAERCKAAPGGPAEALGPDEQNQGGAQGKGET